LQAEQSDRVDIGFGNKGFFTRGGKLAAAKLQADNTLPVYGLVKVPGQTPLDTLIFENGADFTGPSTSLC
jgi:hypothetical protein